LLGVLPDGVAQQDLRALLPGVGPGAARVLAQLELSYFEGGRLRMLAPVRDYVETVYPPAADDLARAMEHYRELAKTEGPKPGRPGGAEAVARLAPEVANLDAMILGQMYRRLARLATEPTDRRRQVEGSRTAWRGIHRLDLVAELDREFAGDIPTT
jgi:hypothetical protein